MRMILESGRPAIFFHSAKAIVLGIDGDQQLVLGRPYSLVIRFQASSIARSLK
jgi:hypothetical protein